MQKGFRSNAINIVKGKRGDNMNLLFAFRSPGWAYYSISCPAGLGNYRDQGLATIETKGMHGGSRSRTTSDSEQQITNN
jgi:hypothetical protein